MNKSQFFNFKRFCAYVNSTLLINLKRILIAIAGLFLIFYILQFWGMPKGDSMRTYSFNTYISNFMFFSIALGVFILNGFKPFDHKVEKRNFLSLPVSTFEKYSAEFLFRVVFGFIALVVLFWLSAHLARFTAMATLTNSMNHSSQIAAFNYPELWNNLFAGHSESRTWFLVTFISYTVAFLFAVRIFFNKTGAFKTFIAYAATGGVFAGLLIVLSRIFNPAKASGFKFDIPVYEFGSGITNVEFFLSIIFAVCTAGLLILGYYKLKEKEL